MASANVDLVRSIYAAWERGDYSSAEWAHPDIEYVVADGPSPGSWTGLVGMAEANRDVLSVWENVRQEAEDYRELDSGRVLVLHRFSARGKKSGLELRQMRREAAALFHVRGGKVTKIVDYFDREHAFIDLGLAPEGDAADPNAVEASHESRSLLGIVRTAEAAIERRDVEALQALMAPECEIVPAHAAVETAVFRGPDAVAKWFAAQDEIWEFGSSEIETCRSGPDWVLVLGRIQARGRGSGAALDVQAAAIWRFGERHITSIRIYSDRERALAELGLASEAHSQDS